MRVRRKVFLSPPTTVSGEHRLDGVNPESVISAIKERGKHLRPALPFADGRKIGLVIEGGAMRGVCSAGGVLALAHLGLTDVFDEVYGTSAGVMNASYFLSHQAPLGVTVYFDSCATPRFINPLRFWKVMDIDYLFEQAVTVDKPLDVDRIRRSRTKFFVALLDRLMGEPILIDTGSTSTDLLTILKAATAVPVFYNRTVQIEGRHCIDGALATPFPLHQAISRGCTDILVLLNRPRDYVCPAPGWVVCRLFDLICARGNTALNHVFATHHLTARQARDLAFGRTPLSSKVNIATLCTDGLEDIGRLTVNRDALRKTAENYGRMILRLFGADPENWHVPLSPRKRRYAS